VVAVVAAAVVVVGRDQEPLPLGLVVGLQVGMDQVMAFAMRLLRSLEMAASVQQLSQQHPAVLGQVFHVQPPPHPSGSLIVRVSLPALRLGVAKLRALC